MDDKVMLKEALSHLKESSKSAIADADCGSFDPIKSYLHLEREIEGQLISFLESVKASNSKKLFLVCGNVGDGKSHLLASIRIKRPDLLSGVIVHNDATESSEPNMSYIDELDKLLSPFWDQHIAEGNEKVVLGMPRKPKKGDALTELLSAASHKVLSKLIVELATEFPDVRRECFDYLKSQVSVSKALVQRSEGEAVLAGAKRIG